MMLVLLQNDSTSSSSGQYSTKVTATANIKVEVVAPMYRDRGSGGGGGTSRGSARDERVTCHRVVCSEGGREKRRSGGSKCRGERRSESGGRRDAACRSTGGRSGSCERARDSGSSGAQPLQPCHHRHHTCCDEDARDRRYCDGDRRRSRHRRDDSDTSDSDDSGGSAGGAASRCWTVNEQSSTATASDTQVNTTAK